jgi:hypothetical protein
VRQLRVGEHQLALAPAHQGLGADAPAIGQREGRQVLDHHLSVVERVPDVVGERHDEYPPWRGSGDDGNGTLGPCAGAP